MRKGQGKKKRRMTSGPNTRPFGRQTDVCSTRPQTYSIETRSGVRSHCYAFFFLVLSSIHFVCFLLFVLFCFIYNIYRTTYLREIIFPCTTHNEHSFFLFQYLTNYLSLKLRTSENNERPGALLWTESASIFCLRSPKDPFGFFIALPRSSDQKISMKCYLILCKLHRTRKIIFKIILDYILVR